MGEENLEDRILDKDFAVLTTGLNVLRTMAMGKEDYEFVDMLEGVFMRHTNDYIDFRLECYDSEGRKVIRETYRILGYNPFNNKQLNRGIK
ncbi:MAG: hypothetical protein DRJ15_08740 [Bacteroidetes bacterium]|nr:MAG: hypothetical protein DRJ15_08740 [Bacteroidota bacterium]